MNCLVFSILDTDVFFFSYHPLRQGRYPSGILDYFGLRIIDTDTVYAHFQKGINS